MSVDMLLFLSLISFSNFLNEMILINIPLNEKKKTSLAYTSLNDFLKNNACVFWRQNTSKKVVWTKYTCRIKVLCDAFSVFPPYVL